MLMKYLWTIVSLICVSYVVNAQNYMPFPTSSDSAVWFESAWSNSGGGGYYELYSNGDTTIDGLAYTKIYRKYDASIAGFYWAAIREHNKVIYLRDVYYENLVADTILYDFNVQVGDTLNWFGTGITSNPVQVLSIDSVQVNGNYQKRLELATQVFSSAFYVVEGIGSNKGLIPIYLEFEQTQDLHCFRLNSNIIWQDNWSNSGCYVSTKELKSNSKITINPNPTTDFFNLTFETIESRTFMIFNQLGQVVLNEQSNDSDVRLDVQTLPKGFYVLAIQTEKGTVTKKIVKQ